MSTGRALGLWRPEGRGGRPRRRRVYWTRRSGRALLRGAGNRGKAKASALAFGLGGEKGL